MNIDRVIKFRIWDTLKREWDTREYFPTFNLDGGFIPPNNGIYVFQRFIGIQDINKKDIYEGDIIQGHKKGGAGRVIGTIVWNNKRLCFEIDGVSSAHFGTALVTSLNNIEVIGNIYD